MSKNSQSGTSSMGSHKHGVSGRAGKSPKFRHAAKMAAEKDERKDKGRIINPKRTVKELFEM